MVLLHSTLVASSLYLLTVCISSQWQDLAQVLLAYNKVSFCVWIMKDHHAGLKQECATCMHYFCIWKIVLRLRSVRFLWQVDVLMDAAFAAVTADIKILQRNLSADHAHSRQEYGLKAEETLNHLCQQCEASIQFLQSLCQQKSFRERLVKNKVFPKELYRYSTWNENDFWKLGKRMPFVVQVQPK